MMKKNIPKKAPRKIKHQKKKVYKKNIFDYHNGNI